MRNEQTPEDNWSRIHDLGGCFESLIAFHRLALIFQEDDRDLGTLLAEAAQVLASAWDGPANAIARIETEDAAGATPAFTPVQGLASHQIEGVVRIQAGCLGPRPAENRWMSPAEEQAFLGALGGMIHASLHRRKVLAAVRDGASGFSGLFDDAPIGMAFVGPDHQLVRVNDALCRILGYSRDQLLCRSIVDLTHPDDVSKDVAQFDRLFRREIASYNMEKRYVQKDGRVLWGLLAATILRDAAGGPVAGIGMLEDITQRKMVEKRLHDAEERQTAGRIEPPGRRPLKGSETILVVEDDQVLRRFVSQILLGNGYDVMQAQDGREAIRFCEEVSGPIHLLLTDMFMAGLNGPETAERIRTIHPETGILYMSGFPDSVLSAQGVLEPGMELLDKPFTVPQLLRKVRQVLGG